MAKTIIGVKAVIIKGHGEVIAVLSVVAACLISSHLEENAKLFMNASILGSSIPLLEDQLKRVIPC